MDNKQMKMISVKSTMERMVQAMIASYEPLKDADAFFTAVERMVAGLFASQQIDNNYIVRPSGKNIEIKFSAGGHCSCLTYMLPPSLEWKVNIKPKVVAEATGPFTEAEREMANSFDVGAALTEAYKQRAEVESYTGPTWQTVGAGGGGGSAYNHKMVVNIHNSSGASAPYYVNVGGSAEERKTEDFVFPHVGTGKGSEVTSLPEFPEPKAVTNRALDAYEKAKKAVEQM